MWESERGSGATENEKGGKTEKERGRFGPTGTNTTDLGCKAGVKFWHIVRAVGTVLAL